jgi:ABC-2 type transport system permease protein
MHLVRALPTLFRVAFAEMVAYRAEMIIWILSATMPLVMLALWDAAAAEGPLAGFGRADFARYFAATLVVRQLTGAWVVWELNQQIRTGTLSPMLLRPLNPLWWSLAETAAALPWRMLVLAPIVAALAWWRPDVVFWPGLATVGWFGVSTVLAFLLAYAVQATFGLLAFWFDQSLGLFQVWFFLWSLLGGYVIPQPLLPPWLGDIAIWLPFHGTLGAPVQVLLGMGDPVQLVATQAAWVTVFAGIVAAMWKAGIRKYGAVGA